MHWIFRSLKPGSKGSRCTGAIPPYLRLAVASPVILWRYAAPRRASQASPRFGQPEFDSWFDQHSAAGDSVYPSYCLVIGTIPYILFDLLPHICRTPSLGLRNHSQTADDELRCNTPNSGDCKHRNPCWNNRNNHGSLVCLHALSSIPGTDEGSQRGLLSSSEAVEPCL